MNDDEYKKNFLENRNKREKRLRKERGEIEPQKPTRKKVEPAEKPSDWWKVPQAAAYLGMSEQVVRRNASIGRIPAHKLPKGSRRGTWYFLKAEIDKHLMNSKKRKPKPPSIHD
jgi:hypothetical protein